MYVISGSSAVFGHEDVLWVVERGVGGGENVVDDLEGGG